MILKLRERLVGAHVHVTVFIGSHRDRTFANAGRLVFRLDEWVQLAHQLENANPGVVVRAECPECGHSGHVGEECLAAMAVGARDAFCDCGRLGAAEPAADDVLERSAP